MTGGHGDNVGFPEGVFELSPKQGVADGPPNLLFAVRYQLKHGAEVLESVPEHEALRRGPDCLVICTDHSSFVWKPVVDSAMPIVDTRNALKGFTAPNIVPLSGRATAVMLAPAAIKRLIEPEEVADAVAWLCSPAATSVTGTSLLMDGGWTAH